LAWTSPEGAGRAGSGELEAGRSSSPLRAPGSQLRSTVIVHRLREGWGVSHWSAAGVRVTPPLNGPHVLVIGDSFTAAEEVNDDEVFTALVQQRLHLPVDNAGATSRSPADYVALAPERHSAWTVIQLNEADLSDDAFNPSKRHFQAIDGHLAIVTPPERPLGRLSRLLARIRPHSALANYAIARIDMFRSDARMPPLFRAADANPPVPVLSPRDWPVEAELQAMTAAYQRRVTFLLLPAFNDAPGDIEQRFLAYCREADVSCADLRDTFPRFRDRGHAPFGFFNSRFGAGHMNAEGHAAAADVLVRELENVRRRGLF
jgi:hypothetical protein